MTSLLLMNIVSSLLLLAANPDQAVERDEVCKLVIEGELKSGVLDELAEMTDCHGFEVEVSSIGGEGLVSLEIADALRKKQAKITIRDFCFSSCAEFLLPAAKSVVFTSDPLVGFHGNPAMKEFLANATQPPGYENCSFQASKKWTNCTLRPEPTFLFGSRKSIDLNSKPLESVQFLMQGPVQKWALCSNTKCGFLHLSNSGMNLGLNSRGPFALIASASALGVFLNCSQGGGHL